MEGFRKRNYSRCANIVCLNRGVHPTFLCLYCAYTTGLGLRTVVPPLPVQGATMQKGSLIRSSRRQGPDVWEYRWRNLALDKGESIAESLSGRSILSKTNQPH